MMWSEITPETRIIDLTVGQLVEIIRQQTEPKPAEADMPARQPGKNVVYGYDGIAEIFGCSRTTAWRIKKSGKIDSAIRQYGRTIIVDRDRALELGREFKVDEV